MNRILIAAATYNEVDNISHFLSEIFAHCPKADLLIVDDSSPDGTAAAVESLKKDYPKVTLLSRMRKLGVGSAHLLMMQYALEKEYDVLITLDADLSHRPADILTIIQLLEQHDFVIGSRYALGGSCDYGILRQSLSRTANFLTRTLLGIRTKETTTSFRGFNRTVLQELPLTHFQAVDYGFFVEIVFWLKVVGAKITEFPIHFHDRRFGQTKISKKAIFSAFLVLLRLFYTRITGSAKKKLARGMSQKEASSCQICHSNYYSVLYPAVTTPTKITAGEVACSTGHHQRRRRIVHCLGCGGVAVNPMPSSEELLSAYHDVVDNTYLENIAARDSTFRHNFKYVKQFIPPEGKLIDIGCYCGVFLKIAKESSYSVIGVEPSKWASIQAREHSGCTVHNGTLCSLPEEEGLFDIATEFDVLEHLIDPVSNLLEINKRLRIGGHFLFSTLDYKNWFSQMLGDRWPWMMDMHLHYFDIELLTEMLQESGFRIIDIHPYSHIVTVEYLFNKLTAITGLKLFSSSLHYLPSFISERQIPFRFGDIKMFTCIKVANKS